MNEGKSKLSAQQGGEVAAPLASAPAKSLEWSGLGLWCSSPQQEVSKYLKPCVRTAFVDIITLLHPSLLYFFLKLWISFCQN